MVIDSIRAEFKIRIKKGGFRWNMGKIHKEINVLAHTTKQGNLFDFFRSHTVVRFW